MNMISELLIHLFPSLMQHKLLFSNVITITFKFHKMSLKSHFIFVLRHVSALICHPQATVDQLKQPHCISLYITCYYYMSSLFENVCPHTSVTLLLYCGVHAVFPLCMALPSQACIPSAVMTF
jgi:hypothetical protein